MLTKASRFHHGTAEPAKIKIQGNKKPKADRAHSICHMIPGFKAGAGAAFWSLNHRLRHFACTSLCIIREGIIISTNPTEFFQPNELENWSLDTEFRFLVQNQRSNAVTLFRSTTKTWSRGQPDGQKRGINHLVV